MTRFRVWVTAGLAWSQGKKTILAGCLLMGVGIAGVATGRLQILDGLTVLGLGFSICGWSAKANRHQAQILTALESVAKAGVDLRLGNKAGAIEELEPVVGEAIQAAAPALSVNISGSSAPEVLAAVTALHAWHSGGVVVDHGSGTGATS